MLKIGHWFIRCRRSVGAASGDSRHRDIDMNGHEACFVSFVPDRFHSRSENDAIFLGIGFDAGHRTRAQGRNEQIDRPWRAAEHPSTATVASLNKTMMMGRPVQKTVVNPREVTGLVSLKTRELPNFHCFQ